MVGVPDDPRRETHTKATGPRITGDAIADAINGELMRQRRDGATPSEAAKTVGRALALSIGRMIGGTAADRLTIEALLVEMATEADDEARTTIRERGHSA